MYKIEKFILNIGVINLYTCVVKKYWMIGVIYLRIAVPAEGKTMESEVCQSFGRTYYFVVVDSETSEFTVIDNEAASSEGGAGIKAAQAVADSGAGVVITFHCGKNAADVLKAANIKIMKAIPGTIADVVQKYKAGELNELSEIHAGYHKRGG